MSSLARHKVGSKHPLAVMEMQRVQDLSQDQGPSAALSEDRQPGFLEGRLSLKEQISMHVL